MTSLERIKSKGKSIVAASVVLAGPVAFAASTATDTVLGKMTTYAVGDLWGTVGAVFAVGLPVLAGAWEAKKTNDLKPLGYGVGAGILAASAFAIGPDLYGYLTTNVF